MKPFKCIILFFIFSIILIACESEDHKHFRESCRTLEFKLIPNIKANWRKHLYGALQKEHRDEQIYLYFKDILSKPDSVLEVYIEGEKINLWRYHISDHPGMPGMYSAILTRFFHEKNEYGQFGKFTVRLSKSGLGNWKICDYEFEVD